MTNLKNQTFPITSSTNLHDQKFTAPLVLRNKITNQERKPRATCTEYGSKHHKSGNFTAGQCHGQDFTPKTKPALTQPLHPLILTVNTVNPTASSELSELTVVPTSSSIAGCKRKDPRSKYRQANQEHEKKRRENFFRLLVRRSDDLAETRSNPWPGGQEAPEAE